MQSVKSTRGRVVNIRADLCSRALDSERRCNVVAIFVASARSTSEREYGKGRNGG